MSSYAVTRDWGAGTQRRKCIHVGESDASPCDIQRQTTGRMVAGDELSPATESADRVARQVHDRTRQPSRRCHSATTQAGKADDDSTDRSSLTSSLRHGLVCTTLTDGGECTAATNHCSRWWSDKPTSTTATESGLPISSRVTTASSVPPCWWVETVSCNTRP